jgi:hypothetical protein
MAGSTCCGDVRAAGLDRQIMTGTVLALADKREEWRKEKRMHRILLDAFAEARRTWDELVTVQPDIMAAGGNLDEASLAEFDRRVGAHREAMDLLADAFEADEEPTGAPR